MNVATPESEMDPQLLELLEEEFMDMAERGNPRAVVFAEVESDDFCAAMEWVTIALLRNRRPTSTYAEALRNKILNSLHKCAPQYARANYDKRREDLEEMREEQGGRYHIVWRPAFYTPMADGD